MGRWGGGEVGGDRKLDFSMGGGIENKTLVWTGDIFAHAKSLSVNVFMSHGS